MKQRKHLPGTSIRARIWQLAGLTCTTVVVLGLLLVLELELRKDADHAVDHTQAVLTALGSFTTLLMDVETGQRGYLLTRQEEFLTPYSRAVAGYRDQLARLKEVMADEAERPQIQRLAAIFDDKLEVVGRTIESAHEGKWEDALAVVNEGRGRRDTEEFRQLGQEIADREVGQLATRQATAERENSNTLAVVLGGGALIIFLTVAAATRTVSQVDGPLRDLLVGIAALADGRLDRRLDIRSSDEIGRVVEAFNDTADHLLAANQARERVEADLAQANRHLLIEVDERGAAQTRLSESLIELARSNEDLDNFAYIASHDLKAPLRGIRNLTDWISEDVKGKVEGDTITNLALLHTRVERLDMLVDSLLQYSRVGRLIYAVEEIDTADLIADIADYIAPPKGFTVAYRGEAPVILSKRAPLEQVLRNLIGNGLKHHDQTEGTVTVGVRDLGDLIEFQIEDDGPGIDPKFHERIFKIFQTLKSRDTLEASGMGLAIVKKAVERHGGTITVESAPPRRGTIFVFTWAKDTPMLAA